MNTKSASLCIGLLILSACSTTRVKETWKDDSQSQTFKNVLVVAVLEYAPYRTLVERDIVHTMRNAGLHANAAVDVLATTDAIDKAAAVVAVEKTGADSVMVIRVVDRETESEYTPASRYVQLNPGGGWYGYYGRSARIAVVPGYNSVDRAYTLETTIFDTATRKPVWSAVTTTREFKDSDALVSYIKAIGGQLRKSGLFK